MGLQPQNGQPMGLQQQNGQTMGLQQQNGQPKGFAANGYPNGPPPAINGSTAERPMPPGWQAILDPSSGDTYYGNLQTFETSWERPSC